MNDNSLIQARLVLITFVVLTLLNWCYVLWLRSHTEIMLNAWFTITPLIGYFYFAFGLFATVGLYYRNNLGLTLAYGMVLFGSLCAVMSYNAAFRQDGLFELTIVPLIVLNVMVACYISFYRGLFSNGNKP